MPPTCRINGEEKVFPAATTVTAENTALPNMQQKVLECFLPLNFPLAVNKQNLLFELLLVFIGSMAIELSE
jgi:hypothetical protein